MWEIFLLEKKQMYYGGMILNIHAGLWVTVLVIFFQLVLTRLAAEMSRKNLNKKNLFYTLYYLSDLFVLNLVK